MLPFRQTRDSPEGLEAWRVRIAPQNADLVRKNPLMGSVVPGASPISTTLDPDTVTMTRQGPCKTFATDLTFGAAKGSAGVRVRPEEALKAGGERARGTPADLACSGFGRGTGGAVAEWSETAHVRRHDSREASLGVGPARDAIGLGAYGEPFEPSGVRRPETRETQNLPGAGPAVKTAGVVVRSSDGGPVLRPTARATTADKTGLGPAYRPTGHSVGQHNPRSQVTQRSTTEPTGDLFFRPAMAHISSPAIPSTGVAGTQRGDSASPVGAPGSAPAGYGIQAPQARLAVENGFTSTRETTALNERVPGPGRMNVLGGVEFRQGMDSRERTAAGIQGETFRANGASRQSSFAPPPGTDQLGCVDLNARRPLVDSTRAFEVPPLEVLGSNPYAVKLNP